MHRCYCSDEDTDEESKGMSHFLEIDTTPSDEACIILHHHYGDASGPITGDYKCATSWKFHEAIHQQIFDYDDDLQTWQTLYGCGPRTLDGSVWNGDFWCDAVDATGEYVGWCECEPASLAPTSAPTEFQTPPFNVDGNTTSTCIAPPDGAAFAEDADGTGRCAASWLYERDEEPWVPGATGCLGRANFGCQKCDGAAHPWCEAVDDDGNHTGFCYCSDEDTDEESKGLAQYFLEFDPTPTDQACTIMHRDNGDAYGPITGDYKCATSWKYTEAFHQLIHEDDDVFQTLQTLYGCGPRNQDGSATGYHWCEAVDATGEYVGWCDCEPTPIGRFVYVSQSMHWSDAQAYCRTNYHDLASIHSASENEEVDALCPSSCWIGGSDAAQEGTWTWSDGTAWDYENWHSGEPNNNHDGENYAEMWSYTNTNRTWNDAGDYTQPFVCSTSVSSGSTPAPTTPAPAAGALGSDGARKTTIHYLGAATILFLAF